MKENMYNTVKKHDAEIDGLRKKTDDHEKRIGTIETRGLGIAPESPGTAVTPNITVSIPDNIATKENVKDLLDDKFKDSIIEGIVDKLFGRFKEEFSKDISKEVVRRLEQKLEAKVAEYMCDGIKNEFAEERRDLRNIVSDMRYKAQSIIAGQWWRAIPHWVWGLFVGLIVGLILSIWGNFVFYNDNMRLQKTEWLYRYERGMYNDFNNVIHRERIFMNGSYHEVDSIKDMVRRRENHIHADTTFVYFCPTDR